MSLFFDLRSIPSHSTVCFDRVPRWSGSTHIPPPSPDYHMEGLYWVRIRPVTVALIWSSLHVRLQSITTSNFLEWLYRLSSLFDAGLAFLHADSPDGRVPIPISALHLQQHIGLSTNTYSPLSPAAFDAYIRMLREESIRRSLSLSSPSLSV